MTLEQVDGCKLIANFIGIYEYKDSYDSSGQKVPIWYCSYLDYRTDTYGAPNKAFNQFLLESKFHSSLDWLAPAWRKLHNRVSDWGKSRYIEMCETSWYKKAFEMGFGMADIGIAFECVIDGIRWYNENK